MLCYLLPFAKVGQNGWMQEIVWTLFKIFRME